MKILLFCIVALLLGQTGTSAGGFLKKEKLFPYQYDHVHGSSLVELHNGDILLVWFQGKGERWADDVRIMGARKKNGFDGWSEPFEMADVKGFPDINPVVFLDGKDRLWLVWYTVLANQWDTSLLNYRISNNYMGMEGAPVWDWQENLLVKPGDKTERGILPDDRFVASVNRQLETYAEYLKGIAGEEVVARWKARAESIKNRAAGKDMIREGRIYREGGSVMDGIRDEIFYYDPVELGYPLSRRLGWQTRSKPVITKSGRLILPLYSDGFGFSLMAITDDWGENWHFSEPLVGAGNIQATIAQKKSGELVAFMRDNGPPPKRLHVSHSTDEGETWSPVKNSDFPNPGTAPDIVTLDDGSWVLSNNDTESGRYRLVAHLSEDEGETWPWSREIVNDEDQQVSAHYQAIVQGKNGDLHLSYSHFKGQVKGIREKTIYYATFNKQWIKGN
jgi:predicted neuraminidase